MVEQPATEKTEPTANQSAHVALRVLLRDRYGKGAMETAMGGDRTGVAACALGSLSNELLLLSHYCGTTNDTDGAMGMLQDVLLAMANRADGAAQMACAELAAAREQPEATP